MEGITLIMVKQLSWQMPVLFKNINVTSARFVQILSLSLLNEVNKGRSSWLYPYLKQLPRSYDLLASFGQFEIEALQIDDAIWTAEKAVHKGKMEWEEATLVMRELNLKPQLITFKAWLWASSTISSRTMHIPWDTAGCLCPVGDFFNYAPPEEVPYHVDSPKAENSMGELLHTNTDRLTDAGFDEKLACYCFYAKTDYKKGEQVLLSYGTYTNLELLEHYGFLLQENPNDKTFISLEPEMYSLCPWPKDSLYISQNGKPSFALLSTLRLWATPASQRRLVKHIAYSGHHISAESEAVVKEWIAKKCQLLLSSCPTSFDEDTLMLRIIDNIHDCNNEAETGAMLCDEIRSFLESNRVMHGKLSTKMHVSSKTRRSICRLKLAVQWRHRYKKILSDCILHCTRMLDNPF